MWPRSYQALDVVKYPRTGDGSHRKWLNPANGGLTVVPDWGSDDLKLGTIPPQRSGNSACRGKTSAERESASIER